MPHIVESGEIVPLEILARHDYVKGSPMMMASSLDREPFGKEYVWAGGSHVSELEFVICIL
jgi:hypothetical protein